ncbi:MAG: hypothetical protein ACO1NX_07455, partial [Chitinophagaceae bacterium]
MDRGLAGLKRISPIFQTSVLPFGFSILSIEHGALIIEHFLNHYSQLHHSTAPCSLLDIAKRLFFL